MTTPWNAAADEAIAHNLADVFENGPRLAWGRKTAEIAIDRQRRYVLKTGLGSLGVGTMWCTYTDEDPEWADLPEQDSTGQFGTDEWTAELRRSFEAAVTDGRHRTVYLAPEPDSTEVCAEPWGIYKGPDGDVQLECRLEAGHDGPHHARGPWFSAPL